MAPAPTRRLRPSPRFAALLAGLALLPVGCGLSQYEGQLSSEAELARQWEEEEKVLGEPLSMPTFPKKEGEKHAPPTWSVFLRPPLGVNQTPVTQPGSKLTQFQGPLAPYTARAGGSLGLQHVYLGVSGDKDFPAAVCGQFGAPAGGETSMTIPRSPVLLYRADEDLKRDITVKRKTWDDGAKSLYSFNFYEYGKSVVAVVYQLNRGAAGKEQEAARKAEPVLQKSLSTLGAGGEVGPMKQAYRNRHKAQ